jgi:hypothetical protein
MNAPFVSNPTAATIPGGLSEKRIVRQNRRIRLKTGDFQQTRGLPT